MKWFAKFCLIVLCMTMLSCSAMSVIFLHNDTAVSLEYRIKATAQRDRNEPLDESGVLASGEVVEALHYFSDSIMRVDLEIKQQGAVRTRSLTGSELPPSLNAASSGGVWSHIKVQEKGFVVGVGSGNWFPDFQHSFGLMWIPCVGFVVILVLIFAISWFVKKSKRIPRKFE